MARRKTVSSSVTGSAPSATIRSKWAEYLASVGMVLICIGLMVPLFSLTDMGLLGIFKWVYAGGALIYTVGRVIGAMRHSGESVRLRRLRRMEFWGGVTFMAGAAFWFYHEGRVGPLAGALYVLKDTILFSLAGAVIQIIAAWLIYYRLRKEGGATDAQLPPK